MFLNSGLNALSYVYARDCMISLSKLHLPGNLFLLYRNFYVHLFLKAADHNLVLLGLLRFSK